MEKEKSIIEAVLFVNGEPMSAEKIAKISKLKKDAVIRALAELKNDLVGRGVVLMEKDGEYQLGTNPEHSGLIEELSKSEFTEELTKAALETLTIVAYRGPLTRASIEYVRGVNSSFILRNLLMRGLVERIDNPQDARSYLYRVSFDFLKHFGLTRPEELPDYEEFRKEKIEVLDNNINPGQETGARPEESRDEVPDDAPQN